MKKIIFIISIMLIFQLQANDLFVVNSISQTLSKIDLVTNEVNNTFAMLGQTAGNAANKVAFHNGFAYVVITYENAIQKIDLEYGQIRSYIFLEDSATPNDIIIANGFAYVTGNVTEKVYKINLETDEVIGNIVVGKSPQGMEVLGNFLYVANTGFDMSDYTYDQGTISKIDLNDFSLQNTINTNLNPCCIEVVNENLHIVCTGDYSSVFGKIDVLNPMNNEIENTIELGGSPGSIANHNDNTVFVGNSWPAGIYAYDANTFDIEMVPADNILQGGNAISVFENYLITTDALDYQQNSLIRIYNTENYELLNQYETAIGATDAKVYQESSFSDDSFIVSNDTFSLKNYPNPFNPETTISFETTKLHETPRIEIFNVKGQKVKELRIKNYELGINEIVWNGTDKTGNIMPSGVYFCKLTVGSKTVFRRMLMVK